MNQILVDSEITCLAYGYTHNILAAATKSGSYYIWDLATGSQLPHQNTPSNLASSRRHSHGPNSKKSKDSGSLPITMMTMSKTLPVLFFCRNNASTITGVDFSKSPPSEFAAISQPFSFSTPVSLQQFSSTGGVSNTGAVPSNSSNSGTTQSTDSSTTPKILGIATHPYYNLLAGNFNNGHISIWNTITRNLCCSILDFDPDEKRAVSNHAGVTAISFFGQKSRLDSSAEPNSLGNVVLLASGTSTGRVSIWEIQPINGKYKRLSMIKLQNDGTDWIVKLFFHPTLPVLVLLNTRGVMKFVFVGHILDNFFMRGTSKSTMTGVLKIFDKIKPFGLPIWSSSHSIHANKKNLLSNSVTNANSLQTYNLNTLIDADMNEKTGAFAFFGKIFRIAPEKSNGNANEYNTFNIRQKSPIGYEKTNFPLIQSFSLSILDTFFKEQTKQKWETMKNFSTLETPHQDETDEKNKTSQLEKAIFPNSEILFVENLFFSSSFFLFAYSLLEQKKKILSFLQPWKSLEFQKLCYRSSFSPNHAVMFFQEVMDTAGFGYKTTDASNFHFFVCEKKGNSNNPSPQNPNPKTIAQNQQAPQILGTGIDGGFFGYKKKEENEQNSGENERNQRLLILKESKTELEVFEFPKTIKNDGSAPNQLSTPSRTPLPSSQVSFGGPKQASNFLIDTINFPFEIERVFPCPFDDELFLFYVQNSNPQQTSSSDSFLGFGKLDLSNKQQNNENSNNGDNNTNDQPKKSSNVQIASKSIRLTFSPNEVLLDVQYQELEELTISLKNDEKTQEGNEGNNNNSLINFNETGNNGFGDDAFGGETFGETTADNQTPLKPNLKDNSDKNSKKKKKKTLLVGVMTSKRIILCSQDLGIITQHSSPNIPFFFTSCVFVSNILVYSTKAGVYYLAPPKKSLQRIAFQNHRDKSQQKLVIGGSNSQNNKKFLKTRPVALCSLPRNCENSKICGFLADRLLFFTKHHQKTELFSRYVNVLELILAAVLTIPVSFEYEQESNGLFDEGRQGQATFDSMEDEVTEEEHRKLLFLEGKIKKEMIQQLVSNFDCSGISKSVLKSLAKEAAQFDGLSQTFSTFFLNLSTALEKKSMFSSNYQTSSNQTSDSAKSSDWKLIFKLNNCSRTNLGIRTAFEMLKQQRTLIQNDFAILNSLSTTSMSSNSEKSSSPVKENPLFPFLVTRSPIFKQFLKLFAMCISMAVKANPANHAEFDNYLPRFVSYQLLTWTKISELPLIYEKLFPPHFELINLNKKNGENNKKHYALELFIGYMDNYKINDANDVFSTNDMLTTYFKSKCAKELMKFQTQTATGTIIPKFIFSWPQFLNQITQYQSSVYLPSLQKQSQQSHDFVLSEILSDKISIVFEDSNLQIFDKNLLTSPEKPQSLSLDLHLNLNLQKNVENSQNFQLLDYKNDLKSWFGGSDSLANELVMCVSPSEIEKSAFFSSRDAETKDIEKPESKDKDTKESENQPSDITTISFFGTGKKLPPQENPLQQQVPEKQDGYDNRLEEDEDNDKGFMQGPTKDDDESESSESATNKRVSAADASTKDGIEISNDTEMSVGGNNAAGDENVDSEGFKIVENHDEMMKEYLGGEDDEDTDDEDEEAKKKKVKEESQDEEDEEDDTMKSFKRRRKLFRKIQISTDDDGHDNDQNDDETLSKISSSLFKLAPPPSSNNNNSNNGFDDDFGQDAFTSENGGNSGGGFSLGLSVPPPSGRKRKGK